ncbi:MAG: hypothetical protein KAI74_04630, partial [Kiritimatiellae bacterium]|nr:hypothetical protein [Kiritimatiellia bacterium]
MYRVMAILLTLIFMLPANVAFSASDGALRTEILAAYNFVVDSNAETPASYAPSSAYLAVKIWNDGTNDLTDVYAYIGNYTNSGVSTPGIYPSRAHPPLVGPLPGGEFALTHEGGSTGTADATRYLGTIPAGEYVAVYWLVSYPSLDENGDAVWGPSTKPDDDLYLFYDIWAEADDQGTALLAEETRKVTMRSEISASANKIIPNGANKVPQKYLDLLEQYEPAWTNTFSDGTPGTRVWTEGYWYDLGNIGEGFDNNGDLVPDHNAWMQPVGDPSLFDASAFRLVKTSALVIIKLNDGTEVVYDVQDQLYFENIPENNRGGVGLIIYEFLPLRSGMSTLSPYQEVASGYDNEKFNGDYGATLGGPIVSGVSKVELNKTGDLTVDPGENIDYQIAFTNTGTVAVGDPDTRMPLVISDTIPSGTVYVAGSAATGNTLPVDVAEYTVFYSTNNTTSWSTNEPAVAADVTDVQWWLSDIFPTSAVGVVTLQLTVDSPYTNESLVVQNNAGLGFGGGGAFTNSIVTTLVGGTNEVGDTVFKDDGTGGGTLGNGIQDGTETGIQDVEVRLYFDSNTNGYIDSADVLIASTNSDATGSYLFSGLPDGDFLAAVNTLDSDLPFGYAATTNTLYSVPLDVAHTNSAMESYLTADFAFAPVLGLSKVLDGTSPVREGDQISYTIIAQNRVAGTGGLQQYDVWATNKNITLSSGSIWTSETNAYIPASRDGNYATIQPTGNKDALALEGYYQPSFQGSVTKVELVIPLTIDPPWNDDTLQIDVYTNLAGGTAIFTTNAPSGSFVTGDFIKDLSSLYSWSTDDFGQSSPLVVVVTGAKIAAQDGGSIGVDQMGFKITTDWSTGSSNPALTLDPVPLTDTYDASILEFVSADPPASSDTVLGSDGTLYWSNVGPLAAGASNVISVTFNVLEPLNNSTGTTTNVVFITDAKYADGSPANSITDSVPVVVAPAGSIGDFVWRDLNADGIQDGGDETGIEGVSVVLTPPAGVDIGNGVGNPVTNVTDSTGFYLFTGLPADGNYTVAVLTATMPGGAGTATYDEDSGTLSPDNTTVVTLNYDATDGSDNYLTADFGYSINSVIKGTVWHDVNRDGDSVPDLGEAWMTNVTVNLYAGTAPTGTVIATTTTDANGFFSFVGAYAGDYTVAVDTSSGDLASGSWVQSYDTDGTFTASYVATSVVLGGSTRADYSYFLNDVYVIGDTLYYDWDGDATQDANEEGILGVTVYLYEDENGNGIVDSEDALIDTDSTDANGKYTFNNRPDGTYQVIVDSSDTDLPLRYNITEDPYLANDGKSVVVISGANDLDQDFGYTPLGNGSIGDTVWIDLNGDGVQYGTRETGISNITVTLQADFNGDGTYVSIATNVTDSAGEYLFEDLPDGDYRVVVSGNDTDLPTDNFGGLYVLTTAGQVDVAMTNNITYLDADFGFGALGAIGDTIFWDANENGTMDYTEGGIEGVTVNLYVDVDGDGYYTPGNDALYGSDVTDADGKYLFTALPAGDYVVAV